jgi:hydrogenase/urease accessory protein HupE
MRFVLVLVQMGLVVTSLFSGIAGAHENRPLYVQIEETSAGLYQVQWKTPLSLVPDNVPTVALSQSCRAQHETRETPTADSSVRRASYRCKESLRGERLSIRYPAANPSVTTLVRFAATNGERHIAVLGPQETDWVIPSRETRLRIALQYTKLGIEHIFGGIDHLLFLLCLLWIAGNWRRLLITVTGFTLAHSLTLAASALNVLRPPIPPVEATIALSLVFLGMELMKGAKDSLTWRHPIAVSVSFGLIHGFGFATALRDAGLPQTDVLTGVLFFNLGVEIGQVGFCATCFILVKLVAKHWMPIERSAALARMAIAYFVGTLGTYWLIDRSIAVLQA